MYWENLTNEERLDAEKAANLLAKSKKESLYTFEDAATLLYCDVNTAKSIIRNCSYRTKISVEWLFNDTATEFDFAIKRT